MRTALATDFTARLAAAATGPAHRSPHDSRKEHDMRYSRRLTVPLSVLCLGFVSLAPLSAQPKPPQDSPGSQPSQPKTSAPSQPRSKPSGKKPETPTKTRTAPKKKRNPREIKILLMDGSVVLGELEVDAIEVKTEFGTLTVPVEKVLSLTPGLDSHKDLSGKIDRLVRELGDDDYKAREAAHKALLGMGPAVRDVLAEQRDDKNAERQRHLKEIVAKLDEIKSQQDFAFAEDSGGRKTWNREDSVVTPNFTIAGDVSPSVFEVRSKYGPLKIGLNDIKRTEQLGLEKGPTIKQVSVAGTHLHLRTPKNSGVRVSAGDTVHVSASGTLVMTPFGSTARSGPNGETRYGTNTLGGLRLPSGALVARVGDAGNWIRIGSRAKFTAPKSGVLKFAIVMRSTYSRGNYVFPGEYKVRIKVDPKD
jgi:hypothetical protein